MQTPPTYPYDYRRPPRKWRRAPLALVLVLGLGAAPGQAAEQIIQRDGVLGTGFTLTLAGVEESDGQAVGAAVLAEIARLENILSIHREDTELARLNRGDNTGAPSPELLEVLHLCEQWRDKTANSFSCRLGALTNTWREAESRGEVPERATLRKAALAITDAPLAVSARHVELHGLRIDPDGLAKGFIVDAALARARELAPQAQGIAIDIGGDAVYWGVNEAGQPWRVAFAAPERSADNDAYQGVLALENRAVAFSGHERRYWRIDHRRFSHIIDPEDGWPATFAPSAVVVAGDATTADALATALTVMPITEGLALIDRLPDVEALVMTDGGSTFASAGWYPLLAPGSQPPPPWDAGMRFEIEYQIPTLNTAEYRRPYAAIWITDENKNLVRQLAVHGTSLRWLREVPLWWRRHGRRDESAIDGLARPTPAPGQHLLAWDGRDDKGRGVAPGNYVLHLEAAREHGGRELITLPFSLSGQAFDSEVRGESELGRISLRLIPGP